MKKKERESRLERRKREEMEGEEERLF